MIFKRISENKELINCHAARVSFPQRARTGFSGLATPSSESQLNKSSHVITVGSSEVGFVIWTKASIEITGAEQRNKGSKQSGLGLNEYKKKPGLNA